MKHNRILALVGGAIATLCLSVGLSLGFTNGFTLFPPARVRVQASSSVLVSAAASLQEALEAIDPSFEQAYPGITVNYNFASSGALQQQIQQGAPIDVFIAAATRPMNALQDQNLILSDTRRNVLTNRLVLIVPRNSGLGLTSFRQLSHSTVRRIAVGEPRSVPVGQYTEELFRNLGILDRLRSKFVLGNNVRTVLAAVESGNADAGVVYTTDAQISNQVRVVATAPTQLHAPILYPIAVVRASRNAAAAKNYVRFLTRRATRTVFERYGFGIAQ